MAWTRPTTRYYYGWYDEPWPMDPTDGEFKSVVVHQLRDNPWTKDEEIEVDVKKGVVILNGQVKTSVAKRAAGDDAWDTPGVTDVSNQLVARDPFRGLQDTS